MCLWSLLRCLCFFSRMDLVHLLLAPWGSLYPSGSLFASASGLLWLTIQVDKTFGINPLSLLKLLHPLHPPLSGAALPTALSAGQGDCHVVTKDVWGDWKGTEWERPLSPGLKPRAAYLGEIPLFCTWAWHMNIIKKLILVYPGKSCGSFDV